MGIEIRSRIKEVEHNLGMMNQLLKKYQKNSKVF